MYTSFINTYSITFVQNPEKMKKSHQKPFPRLTTNRLVLRQLKEEDGPELFELRADTRVNTYLDRPIPKSIEETLAFIKKVNNGVKKGENIYWVLCTRDSPRLMGAIGLRNFSGDRTIAEIGYELLPRYQQQGFMQEALQRVIDYGFTDLQLQIIQAYTHKDNAASARLLQKNGFLPAIVPESEDDGYTLAFIIRK